MPLSRLSSPFLSGTNRVTLQMLQLLMALVPAVIAIVYFFGPSILITLTLAVVVALLAEAFMLKLRNRPLKPFLTDGSAIVTAVLLAIALPPLAPWWLTTIGILFAIIFAKHLYGGLGYNPFNPAMIAYVLLLISFPLEMTTWLPVSTLSEHPLGLASAFNIIFSGQLQGGIGLDTVSGATPLDAMKTQIGLLQTPSQILNQPLFGLFGGKGWEWINIWFAIGGIFLIFRRVIGWHIPVAMLAGLTAISFITWLIAPETTGSPIFHLLSGGTMIGAFFIATDPVTAATTIKGRLIFGAGVGLLTYIIRVWGGYPDGIAFAVILMNMLVPLIDYYTQPKVYGSVK
ncbi:MAG: electron transport complex subunit RsxD [Gammaproteobacteria bacterium]|nr:MAG: electron transport complex subunit RsxD [Gammaproteobacteria bacterium]RKZ95698.1 MAG: electron transport complex subunit RsxD [Gammaproteobacteria bacterium]RKZ97924.1 MAG: electron transport complex subunit RsxD [Gammaproteobacteria bacterium]RLA02153.1 MAG: electron transport complex subunit RsxD [Gammaproteobacteria bacterium]